MTKDGSVENLPNDPEVVYPTVEPRSPEVTPATATTEAPVAGTTAPTVLAEQLPE